MSGAVATPARSGLQPAAEPRRWSPARLAGTAVLVSWATLFWFLLLTGRDALYLSARTDWVVPVAAVLLTASALGRFASSRTDAPEPIRARELWIMALMVIPVL
ncbi:MAG TPA: hypothetical protein VF029_04840, partial [Actinomycetota bacterium]